MPSHEIRLMARRDRFGRGGDHSGFNAEGLAAIGFRESRENYSKQHNANDTLDGVSFPYLAQNARANAAGMAVLALAPPPPEVRREHAEPPAVRLRRAACAGPRRRAPPATGSSGARRGRPTGSTSSTSATSPSSCSPNKNIDDHVFGVAAVGPGGHESTISAYVMASAQ